MKAPSRSSVSSSRLRSLGRLLPLIGFGLGVGSSVVGCDGGGTFPLALEVKDVTVVGSGPR